MFSDFLVIGAVAIYYVILPVSIIVIAVYALLGLNKLRLRLIADRKAKQQISAAPITVAETEWDMYGPTL